tara:strand:+ start:1860 stop:3701 length:1842 start_codon:yes stop_codon:yes gene_type:complete
MALPTTYTAKGLSMMDYRAPLKEISFSLNEVLNYDGHAKRLQGVDTIERETTDAVFSEYAKFCEDVLSPLYRSSDEEGCVWSDGNVETPSGFKEAFRQYAEAGWFGMASDPSLGGQGLPTSLSLALGEITGSANLAFTLYTGGLSGAIETMSAFATPEQLEVFQPKLIAGEWNATMCLTEPHCGTDLGLLKTKAEAAPDGAYKVNGTKIFITGGEHDLTENIVHLVLARLPDAPAGNKGISLFIVPKLLPVDGGTALKPNGVSCGAIEKKMGIKGSATCVMHFDEATGYLLGEPNRGLQAMFKFINASRVRAAFQGLSHAELGFQKSLAYAHDRLQMRSLSGVKAPASPADPIIVHPDVRRMLMTQKVIAEGSRVMLHYLAMQLDIAESGTDPTVRERALHRLDLMTPIAKGFVTEAGFEAANLGLQCFGGHGYIREWGVEQNVRDARIATLYEGTTGIQALDLIGRKVLGSNGALLNDFAAESLQFCGSVEDHPILSEFVSPLRSAIDDWCWLADYIATRAEENPDEIGAASYDFLMYSGYVCLGFFWLRAAAAAAGKISRDAQHTEFYKAKLSSTQFYYQRILPRIKGHKTAINAGAESMMALDAEHFSFQ